MRHVIMIAFLLLTLCACTTPPYTAPKPPPVEEVNTASPVPPHTASGAQAPAPLGAKLLQEQAVTLRDLLAHASLYGEWAREVYAIALGWNELSQSWGKLKLCW